MFTFSSASWPKSQVRADWAYQFQNDTHRKRDLSPKQMKWRHDINRRVLAYFQRRGI